MKSSVRRIRHHNAVVYVFPRGRQQRRHIKDNPQRAAEKLEKTVGSGILQPKKWEKIDILITDFDPEKHEYYQAVRKHGVRIVFVNAAGRDGKEKKR